MSIILKDYFNPFLYDISELPAVYNTEDTLGRTIYFPDENTKIETLKNDLVIIGIPEDRNSKNKGSRKAPDTIRKELYKLYKPSNINIADLGNIKPGKTLKDTYFALTETIYECLKNEIAVIIIGGTKDHIVPVSKAYEKGKNKFNLCVIDSLLNLGNEPEIISPENYLSHIIKNNKKLFSYTNIGYQTYYNSQEDINYIKENFEAVRLGTARTNLFDNEPYIRDADFVAADIGSVKMSDAPGNQNPPVHGFYGEEICQLAKYSGLSDKVSAFGLFEINPENDIRNRTSALGAQIIWHFIEAFYQRKNETYNEITENYKKYIVNIENTSEKLIFYKSPKTGRWWVEVPYHIKSKELTYLLSCGFDDYLKAGNNEIPERWWNFYKKLN